MKRMVDLTIKNNKVTAIDGYEVGAKPTNSLKPFFRCGR
nr:MAG TPA: hypothetical protein [Caudoviricetes sp.]